MIHCSEDPIFHSVRLGLETCLNVSLRVNSPLRAIPTVPNNRNASEQRVDDEKATYLGERKRCYWSPIRLGSPDATTKKILQPNYQV